MAVPMTTDWQVVLTADGAVLAVAGGAPSEWIGTRLDDRGDLPAAMREAVRTLLDDLHGSISPMAAATTEGPTKQAIQLIAIEAVPLRRAAIDLRELLVSSVNLMTPQASAAGVDLTLTVDPAQPASISVDPEKVAWAVTALIGNALRYVRRGSRLMPGGLISITTTYDPAAAHLVIAVRDDGVGIPPDKLPNLFRRTTDHPMTAGLGLRLMHDVVSAHGGRVDVESRTDTSDHGTTVLLTFPVL